MALLWFDGFEGYNSYTDLQKAGYNCSNSSNLYSSDARTGTNCIRAYTGSSIYKSIITGSEDTFVFGFGVKFPGLSQSFFRISNSNMSTYDLYLDLSGGLIRLGRYSSTYILATATQPISAGVWYFFEAKVQLSNSTTITCSCRINGVEILTLSPGADLLYDSAISNMSNIIFSTNTASTPYMMYDDFYFCDTTGSNNNDYLGQIRVDTIYPNANGNSSDWDGSDGNQVDNYQLIDENPISESDYVEAQNVNEKDLYGYGSLNYSVGTIHGVKVNSYFKKTTASLRTLKHVCRSNSTDYDSGTEISSDIDALFGSTLWETDPATSSPWTTSGLSNAEFGIKVYS